MREYSPLFRAWHWLFALSIFIVSSTVLLRETYLNGHQIADILAAKFKEHAIVLSEDQLENLSELITGGFWDWHIIFGYVFVVLVVLRVVTIIKKGFDYPKEVNTHKKLVYTGYKVLYVLLILMACSGVILHQEEFFSFSEQSLEIIEEIHGLIGYAIMIFIPLHIIGVVVTDIKEDKGLVSRIISGNK